MARRVSERCAGQAGGAELAVESARLWRTGDGVAPWILDWSTSSSTSSAMNRPGAQPPASHAATIYPLDGLNVEQSAITALIKHTPSSQQPADQPPTRQRGSDLRS
jgi:hypothetical protein